jgi:hypothetical protein
MSLIRQLDYVDADVSYLLGLITARGRISEISGNRQVSIEFPYHSLEAQGIHKSFDVNTSIRLGLSAIRERILEITGADISIIEKENEVVLAIRFLRSTMSWRNILMHTQGKTGYEHFTVPEVLFSSDVPKDWKREYVRGYADVAGNVRHSNRYTDGTNRVRLDVLNYPSNWEMPVQLCTLLEEHLEVPVQLITWGHPNMGRDFREHQVNIFALPFGKIGFSLNHKQEILDEFIEYDRINFPNRIYSPCFGRKKLKRRKPRNNNENNEHLDERIRGQHFNAYWQICKKMGCTRTPKVIQQLLWEFNEQEALEEEPDEDISAREGNVS